MPVIIPDAAGKPYRPSNGTEGEYFEAQWCASCKKQPDMTDPHFDGEWCEISVLMHAFDIDAPEYPKELVYDHKGKPKCKAYQHEKDSRELPEPRCEKTKDMFE